MQLLRFVPSHLTNTSAFLQKLRKSRLEDGYVTKSFDVSSLYTNVSRDDALQAVSEILSEHHANVNLYGLSIAQIMTLVNECLSCSLFR